MAVSRFHVAELGRSIPEDEYEKAVPDLRLDLLTVQNDLLNDPKFSVIVLVSGVEGAGKGDTVNTLHAWLDPRYLQTYGFPPPSEEESERPEAWRFLRCLPPRGRIAIFFGSWYTKPILDRVQGLTDDQAFQHRLDRIQTFEQMLTDDGTLLVKLWFHLSKEAQKRRLETLSADPKLAWRVSPHDWELFDRYDAFVPVCETAVRETSTGSAPWTVIEGEDRFYRQLTVGRHLVEVIREHQASYEPHAKPKPPKKIKRDKDQPTLLSALDLDLALSKEDYERELETWQGRLNVAARHPSMARKAVVAVFEGADAAGKGGAIRRASAALDARYYRIIPIGAPSDEEKARHYLWRFWRQLPRLGHMVIFDRSWYGRVLVERVEGYATEAEWRRAYREINEFEESLAEFGYGIAKLWLQIDRNEQKKRFKDREKTPYKNFKITQEDYRNREKWGLYQDAVNEMIERTSTSYAPWTLIEANDKRYARIKVLKTLTALVERMAEDG